MKTFGRTLLIATALVAPAAMASAATTISYTSTFGAGTVGQTGTTDFTATGSVQGFDTTKGTLTGVVITYDFAVDMIGSVQSTAASTATFKFTESVEADFTTAGAYSASPSLTTSESQTYTNYAPGQSGPFGEYTYAMTDVQKITSLSGDLSAFYNTPLNYSVTTFTGQTVLGGGGNMNGTISTTAKGSVTVAYTYDAVTTSVPEPASWAMMVGGFGLLGGALRRKKGVSAVTFG